ncbi:MAG: sensor histidine kinase [Chitinophagaceae bacterium]|nr:sensor histidine kinase [Chitinophagaceae bacterium]
MRKLLFSEYIYYVTVSALINCLLVIMIAGNLFNVGSLVILYAAMLVTCTIQFILADMLRPISGVLQLVTVYALSYIVTFLTLLLIFNTIFFTGESIGRIALISCISLPFQLSVIYFNKYYLQSKVVKEKEQQIAGFSTRQKAKEIEVLKQQIDPHFIFNSFNTLSFLIGEDSNRAKAFSDKLANVYRYIIFNGNKNLIGLAEELEFAKNYSYLQEIRHSNEVEVVFSNFSKVDNILIIPVSIQLLIENAIKHNEFSEATPLIINVTLQEKHISVENNKRLKITNTPVSSKIGLINLRERCNLIMHNELVVIDSPSTFTVQLPVHRH